MYTLSPYEQNRVTEGMFASLPGAPHIQFYEDRFELQYFGPGSWLYIVSPSSGWVIAIKNDGHVEIMQHGLLPLRNNRTLTTSGPSPAILYHARRFHLTSSSYLTLNDQSHWSYISLTPYGELHFHRGISGSTLDSLGFERGEHNRLIEDNPNNSRIIGPDVQQ